MKRYVIIGDGTAGMSGADAIRRHDPDGAIFIISQDVNPYYYRAGLTNYLMGQLRDDELWAIPPDYYIRNQINRIWGQVIGVDPQHKHVALTNGQQVPFDSLLIASGSSPNALSVQGAELDGVMPWRTLQDARRIVDMIPNIKRAVITGSGSLGLEWVEGLRDRGIEVTYIIRDSVFYSRICDKVSSDIILNETRRHGVDLVTEDEIVQILGQNGKVSSVMTRKGREIPCQLVGAATGVKPNIAFLIGSGIKTDRGVLVDDRMQTNIPGIFAAGDVAQVLNPETGKYDPPVGLWQPGKKQGEVAGLNIVGQSIIYRPGVLYVATHMYGMNFGSLGETNPKGSDCEVLTALPSNKIYQKVVLKDNKVVGALFLGDRRKGLYFKKLIDWKIDISPIKNQLLDSDFDLGGWVRERQAERGEGGFFNSFALAQVASTAHFVDINKFSAKALSQDSAVSLVMSNVKGSVEGIAPRGAQQAQLIWGETIYHLQPDATITIGRNVAGSQNIIIADPSVSRNHAQIRAEAGIFFIHDLGSTNGTWLNEQKLTTSAQLKDGDEIRVGDIHFSFKVTQQGVEAVPAGSAVGWVFLGEQIFPIAEEITSIGRVPENVIVVPDPAASRLHAQIQRFGDRELYLRDMGSRNGTRVNGEMLTNVHLLQDGDVITIGSNNLQFSTSPQRSASSGTPSQAQPPKVPAATEATRVVSQPVAVAAPVAATAEIGKFVVKSGTESGREYPLSGDHWIIGRGDGCEVRLQDDRASRKHAEAVIIANLVTIRDAGSVNGTVVNGNKLGPNETCALKPGDQVQIGQTVLEFQPVGK